MTPTGVPLMKSSDQVSVGMGFRCIGKRQPPFDGCWGVVQRIELDRGRGPLMKKRPPMVAVVVTLMMAVVVTLLLLLLSSRPRQQGRSPPPLPAYESSGRKIRAAASSSCGSSASERCSIPYQVPRYIGY